jgi:hypothetical protein
MRLYKQRISNRLLTRYRPEFKSNDGEADTPPFRLSIQVPSNAHSVHSYNAAPAFIYSSEFVPVIDYSGVGIYNGLGTLQVVDRLSADSG